MIHKSIGYRDIVETLYYREILQNDENLRIINSYTHPQLSSWKDFHSLEQSKLANILRACEGELECEPKGQDDLGLRRGGYPIDVIAWEEGDDQQMFSAAKLNE